MKYCSYKDLVLPIEMDHQYLLPKYGCQQGQQSGQRGSGQTLSHSPQVYVSAYSVVEAYSVTGTPCMTTPCMEDGFHALNCLPL